MVAAVSAAAADAVVDRLTAAGVPSWVAGTVGRRTDDAAPAAHLVGAYR